MSSGFTHPRRPSLLLRPDSLGGCPSSGRSSSRPRYRRRRRDRPLRSHPHCRWRAGSGNYEDVVVIITLALYSLGRLHLVGVMSFASAWRPSQPDGEV